MANINRILLSILVSDFDWEEKGGLFELFFFIGTEVFAKPLQP